jgi:3-phosphoshikimate 1-carboxyvinyltransferase
MSRSWLESGNTKAWRTTRPQRHQVKILFVIIHPAKRIRGRLVMPGDKSISHRAAMIAAVAEGTSRLKNYSTSADCAATLSCLQQLGVGMVREGNGILIHGVGANGLQVPGEPLDCGNSGTTMRLLAGILAGQDFASTLTGDESLQSRPMQRIIEPLQMMGANISSNDGRAPVVIQGRRPLKAITYELLVASAQVKSCVLLAGLYAEGRSEVIENEITRDHTERILRLFGVSMETGDEERKGENARFAAVTGPSRFQACPVSIPGDISSAAYFIAAAALLPGSSLEIRDVGVNPTRVLFLKQLRALGLNVEIAEVHQESNEPVGIVHVRGGEEPRPAGGSQSRFTVRGLIIPQLIDELPLLAVIGSQFEGGIEIRGAAELRVKESDRIATTVRNLRAMGADVEEFDDGLRVAGRTRLRGAKIDPRGDHRIAMAFTVAGLIADGETEIEDAECVAVSFPEFFELLDSVVER